jgi:hypothetical protein
MTHSHVRRRLSEYLERELSPRDERAIEAHLAACPSCAAELRALERSLEWLHALPAPEPPSDLGDAVLERLRAGEGQSRWRLLSDPAGERRATGWLAPVAAAVAIGAITWLGNPLGRIGGTSTVLAQGGPAERALAGSPAGRAANRLGGIRVVPAGAPRPSMQSCVERSGRGEPADECAAWYAWFVAMALEDARGFAREVAGLPASARDPWLERVTEFAARSGSAPLVGDQLRSSHDPGAIRIAKRFDRGGNGLVRTVGFGSDR